MAWAFVGVSNVVEVSTTAHALVTTGITGLAAGDLLVACISSRIASTTSVTLPSGWTLVGEQKNNNVLTTSSALPSGLMAYCIRGASDPALTFTHPTAPAPAIGRIVAYRGGGGPDAQTSFTTATAITAVSGAGLTTTQADDLVIAMAAGGQEAAWSSFSATSPSGASGATSTATPTTAWLERADTNTTTGNDTSLAIFDAIKTTAGATGNLTATASVSAGHVVVAGAFKISLADAWNNADKAASLALSNSDKTVTTTAASGGVRSTTAYPLGTAGKYYAELVLTSAITSDPYVGLKLKAGLLGGTTSAIYITPFSGTIALAGTSTGVALGALATGDIICIAIDMGAERVWFRKNSGNWNNDASANPATGTNGIDISSLANTDLNLWMQNSGAAAGNVVAIRTKAAELTQSPLPSSGFTDWMGGALSSVTNYTMPAATGAVVLNGPVNKLAYGRVVPASAGVFALTGTDAGMRRGYTLAAVPSAFALSGKVAACHLKRAAVTGTFALAGQGAILRYARVFPAAKGTVTLAGPVTGMVAARFVRSTPTAYTLSGKDATLNWTSVVLHRTMPAATGALVVNGQAAALKRTYFVPHTTGAITLNGVAVAMRAIRTMPAVKGTVTLGGVATGLRYGHVTVTTTGVFTLNGVAASLRYSHVLTAAPGAVVLAGQPIIFGYGSAKTMTASTGTVTLNGPVTKLAYGRVFPATAGAFTLAGQANTLRYARVMPAVKATFTLNGVVAGLRLSHNIVVTEATFTLSGKPVTLRYARLMTATSLAVVLNGPAANLIWSGAGARSMPAAPGAFVLSGKVVSFKQTAVVKATVTTFTLTGPATTLATARRLSAATDAVTLSGKTAGLKYVRGMSAETGALVVTGQGANLLRLIVNRYFMQAEPGSIRLSGKEAWLSWSGTAQPGMLEFGQKAYIRRW